jgi:hypothetical protein
MSQRTFRFPPTPVDPQTRRVTDENVIDMFVAATALARVYKVPAESMLTHWAPCLISRAQRLAKATGRIA